MTLSHYRSILVPLDGTPFAEQALPLAVAIARRTGADLRLALVHHPVPALAMAMDGAVVSDAAPEVTRDYEEAYLDATVTQLREQIAGTVTRTLLDGPVGESLCAHARSLGIDVVVMATHGRGALGRLLAGSVADRLLRQLHLPLLLVRGTPGRAGPATVRHALVALDGSAFAEAALASAIALGGPFGARYTLLQVIPPAVAAVDLAGLYAVQANVGANDPRPVDGSFYLERLATQLRRRGAVVATRIGAGPVVATTILEQAAAVGADVIALASHGTGGMTRLVMGSVAEQVLRKSTLPVLVDRPGPAAT